jgi:DNA-binding NtrC family response regulator
MKSVFILAEDPLIRNVVSAMFVQNGFAVNEAPQCVCPGSASDCDLLCCSTATRPDLVMLEVIVHRACSGVESAQKILRRWPGVRVLLTSASSSDMWPGNAATLFNELPGELCAFLAKPFTIGQLKEKVEHLLFSGS